MIYVKTFNSFTHTQSGILLYPSDKNHVNVNKFTGWYAATVSHYYIISDCLLNIILKYIT